MVCPQPCQTWAKHFIVVKSHLHTELVIARSQMYIRTSVQIQVIGLRPIRCLDRLQFQSHPALIQSYLRLAGSCFEENNGSPNKPFHRCRGPRAARVLKSMWFAAAR